MGKFVFAALSLMLVLPCGGAYAQEAIVPTPDPTPTAQPTPTPTPTPPRTPFFGDLEDRFSIIAAGHRLLRSSYDIDRVVGDPHTLRHETLGSFSLIPDRMKLNLARILADRAVLLYMIPNTEAVHPKVVPNTIAMSFTSDMSDQFQGAAKDAFGGAFAEDQLIDLGVFLLSKAPFFPKDGTGWEKWKQNIVTYDVYLALLVVAATAATDQGRIGAAGMLYKSENDEYRVGWYGKLENLGFKFKPAGNIGLKWRSETAEMSGGVRANTGDGEKFAWEWSFVENWFAKFVRPKTGWETQASMGARYVVSHTDPVHAKVGSLGASAFAKKTDFLEIRALSASFGGNANINTKGHHTGNLSALIENQRTNILGTVSLGYDTNGIVSDPRFPEQKRNWKLGGFIGGPLEDTFELLKSHVRASADLVERDLADVRRMKKAFDEMIESILALEKVSDEQEAIRKLYLGMARLHLRRHLSTYRQALARYTPLKRSYEPTMQLLSDDVLAEADREAASDTFNAERHRLYRDGLGY